MKFTDTAEARAIAAQAVRGELPSDWQLFGLSLGGTAGEIRYLPDYGAWIVTTIVDSDGAGVDVVIPQSVVSAARGGTP